VFPDPGTSRWPDVCSNPPCCFEDGWICGTHTARPRCRRRAPAGIYTCDRLAGHDGSHMYFSASGSVFAWTGCGDCTDISPCVIHDTALWNEIERRLAQ
jgi:hypothetical protein